MRSGRGVARPGSRTPAPQHGPQRSLLSPSSGCRLARPQTRPPGLSGRVRASGERRSAWPAAGGSFRNRCRCPGPSSLPQALRLREGAGRDLLGESLATASWSRSPQGFLGREVRQLLLVLGLSVLRSLLQGPRVPLSSSPLWRFWP